VGNESACAAHVTALSTAIEYRHLPDVFQCLLSAFAGWTIGICRMFFRIATSFLCFSQPQNGLPVFRYKAIYKYLLVNKERIAGVGPPAFEKNRE